MVLATAVGVGFGRESPLTRDTEAADSWVTKCDRAQTAAVLLVWWPLGHASAKDPAAGLSLGPAQGAEGQGGADRQRHEPEFPGPRFSPSAARPGQDCAGKRVPAQGARSGKGRRRAGRAGVRAEGRWSGLWTAAASGLGTRGAAASGAVSRSPARSRGHSALSSPAREAWAVPALGDSEPRGTRVCHVCPASCALPAVPSLARDGLTPPAPLLLSSRGPSPQTISLWNLVAQKGEAMRLLLVCKLL